MPFIIEVLLSRWNVRQAAKQKWTCSLYINFLTWDTPQVKKHIWITLFGMCQTRATSYEFLYLGRAKSEPLQMSFCTWDTPQMPKYIWIPWCGHPAVNELMWIWSHVFSKIKNLRGGNTRLRGRIARAPFRRYFVSRLAIYERALAKRLFGECIKGSVHSILFGVQGTNLFGVQKVLSHVHPFRCFSIRTVYLLWSSAKSTCFRLYLLWAKADIAKCLLVESSCVGDDFVGRIRHCTNSGGFAMATL